MGRLFGECTIGLFAEILVGLGNTLQKQHRHQEDADAEQYGSREDVAFCTVKHREPICQALEYRASDKWCQDTDSLGADWRTLVGRIAADT